MCFTCTFSFKFSTTPEQMQPRRLQRLARVHTTEGPEHPAQVLRPVFLTSRWFCCLCLSSKVFSCRNPSQGRGMLCATPLGEAPGVRTLPLTGRGLGEVCFLFGHLQVPIRSFLQEAMFLKGCDALYDTWVLRSDSHRWGWLDHHWPWDSDRQHPKGSEKIPQWKQCW